jgi:hypothetical protein
MPYVNLEVWQQAAMRGKLLKGVDPTCATCRGGVDLDQARQSIFFLAEAFAGSCQQTADLVRRFSGEAPMQWMSYEEFMRLTLANYHMGSGCLKSSLQNGRKGDSWRIIAATLPTGCSSGVEYIRRIEEQIAH